MLTDAAALARELHIYLLAGYVAYLHSDHMPFSENRAALFSPEGDLVFDYAKAHPIPGNPYDAALPSGAPVPVADTPLGRIATVICYDSDFPLFTAGVGRAGADFWLVPAFDWEGIHSIHSRMARLRTVEEGASMLRITSHAQSVASDPYGRVLAIEDDLDGANDGTMIAMLPAQHAYVIAPWIAGLISPLALAGLAALMLFAWFGVRQPEAPMLAQR
jgi:apolipoprotein N-acyltransferase